MTLNTEKVGWLIDQTIDRLHAEEAARALPAPFNPAGAVDMAFDRFFDARPSPELPGGDFDECAKERSRWREMEKGKCPDRTPKVEVNDAWDSAKPTIVYDPDKAPYTTFGADLRIDVAERKEEDGAISRWHAYAHHDASDCGWTIYRCVWDKRRQNAGDKNWCYYGRSDCGAWVAEAATIPAVYVRVLDMEERTIHSIVQHWIAQDLKTFDGEGAQ